MSNKMESIEQSWQHATAEIPARGLDVTRIATPAERALLAASANILGIDRLEVTYCLSPLVGGRYRLTATFRADVSQACVVTLDPVPAAIVDHLDVEFRPPGELAAEITDEEEQSVLEAEEHEPIEQGRIAVGRIVAETLAAALPAYPRAPGAELEQHEAGPADPGAASPFAALAGWKPKR